MSEDEEENKEDSIQNLVIFLGGSQRKHVYICEKMNEVSFFEFTFIFNNLYIYIKYYPNQNIKFTSFSTKDCLKIGAKKYAAVIKQQQNLKIIAVITLYVHIYHIFFFIKTLYIYK